MRRMKEAAMCLWEVWPSSPSQLCVAGPLSPYNVIIYLFCTELLLYSKDMTFNHVPWFIICVILGPNTTDDYVRVWALVPQNLVWHLTMSNGQRQSREGDARACARRSQRQNRERENKDGESAERPLARPSCLQRRWERGNERLGQAPDVGAHSRDEGRWKRCRVHAHVCFSFLWLLATKSCCGLPNASAFQPASIKFV
jgi:hypothetical protein